MKYPCIHSRSGIVPTEYIGIMFNGDVGMYHKDTVKALKKAGSSKELINSVKSAKKSDLAISKLLIENNQFDVLVTVYNEHDSRTAVFDYLDELYHGVVDNSKTVFSDIEKNFSKKFSQLGENPDLDSIIESADMLIADKTEKLIQQLSSLHEEVAKDVIKKYHEACERKLIKLHEEIDEIMAEKEKLQKIITIID